MNQDVSLKFKNSVTGQAKLDRYYKSLTNINTILGGTSKGAGIDVTSQMNNNTKATEKFGNSLTKAFNFTAIIIGLKKVINLMTNNVELTSSYIEKLNLMDVAFNSNTTSAEKFINTLSEMYGIDESTLTDTVGTFKQLANAMGIAGETGTNMSKVLTQLSIDASSLYNTDFETAVTKMESALAGQTKAIRSFGADITESSLALQLQKEGIDKNVDSLTYAEKRLVIVMAVMDQLSNAQNDYGRTSESLANQTKVLSEQWSRLGRAMGNVFFPILKAVLPYLNAVLMVLVEIINTIANLVGFDLSGEDYFSVTDDSVLDLVDDLDSATDSAKKLKSGLRGFDKLNVITTPSSSSTSTSGVKGGTGLDNSILDAFNKAYSEYDSKLESISMKATKIRDNIMDVLGFTKHINTETGDIYYTYDGWQETVKGLWNWFQKLNNVSKIFVGIGLYLVFKNIWNIGKKLIDVVGKTGLWKAFTNLINPLGEVSTYFLKTYKNTGMLNNSLQATIKDNKELLTGMNGVKTALGGVVTSLTGLLLFSEGIKSMKQDGISLINVIELVSGAILGISGALAIVTPIVVAFGGTMTSTMVGATAGISLVITAIVGLVAWMTTSSDKTSEYSKTLEDLNKTAKESANTTLAQIDRNQELSKELEYLVDSNGKVKASDEDRVNYILTRLNDAYQTSYKLVDGKIYKNDEEIGSNKDLIKSIDDVMEKKKAEALLNAYLDVYNEALKQQKELMKEASKLQEGKTELSEKEKKKLQELKDQYDTNNTTITNYEKLQSDLMSGTIDDITKSMKYFYDDSKESYNTAFGALEKSANDTKKYCDSKLGSFTTKMNVDTTSFDTFAKKFNSSEWNTATGLTLPSLYVPRYKSGIDYVPNDFHLAFLDKGERVLTAQENQAYSKGYASDVVNNSYTNNNNQSSFNPTIVVQVGNEELARKVISNLQDMAISDGKPITIGG